MRRTCLLTLAIWMCLTAAAEAQWGRLMWCSNYSCEMCWGATPFYTGRRTRTYEHLPDDYAGTPQDVIDRALTLAGVGEDSIVSDLGCGDARVVIAAAERGATAYGYEKHEYTFEWARRRIKEARRRGVKGHMAVSHCDLFVADLTVPTVVFCHLEHHLLERLVPMFREKLRPGATVVSYIHPLPGAEGQIPVECDGKTIWFWQPPPRFW